MNNKILIIAAHPDDEVLGCGGTISKYAKEGSLVYCLFLGKGKASRFKSRKKTSKISLEEEQANLKKEAQKAAKIVGISQVFFANFPDQEYDKVPIINIVKKIEQIKKKIEPDTVFTHYHKDLNLDHQITAQAVLTACRPLKNQTVKEIYMFETASSTEWGYESTFTPNVFIDIKKTFIKKTEALKTYQSEIREHPHPRSIRSLEIVARRWGTMVSRELVEAFILIRKIN